MREFEELGGGAFKKGAAGTLGPAGALVARPAVPPASASRMKGKKRPQENDEEPWHESDAEENC